MPYESAEKVLSFDDLVAALSDPAAYDLDLLRSAYEFAATGPDRRLAGPSGLSGAADRVAGTDSGRSLVGGPPLRPAASTVRGPRDLPEAIRCDNAPEFIAQPFVDWCETHGVKIRYIQPGKPDQIAYIERFNRTYREEVLNAYIFETLDQVRAVPRDWIRIYNEERPHDALGKIPPAMFRRRHTPNEMRVSTFEWTKSRGMVTLYSEESVADYVSESVSVVLPDGTCESAVCYSLPEPKLEGGTNSKYASSLLLLAGGLGFPDDYLQQIRKAVNQS